MGQQCVLSEVKKGKKQRGIKEKMIECTDQQTYLPVEMQFYISMMFLGLPDEMHEEKPLFLQLKKNA